MEGGLSRGLEIQAALGSVCRRVHWKEGPVQGRTQTGLGLGGNLGDHTLSWSSWSCGIWPRSPDSKLPREVLDLSSGHKFFIPREAENHYQQM